MNNHLRPFHIATAATLLTLLGLAIWGAVPVAIRAAVAFSSWIGA